MTQPGLRETEVNDLITVDDDGIRVTFQGNVLVAERGQTLPKREYDEIVHGDKVLLIQQTVDQLETRFQSFENNNVLNNSKIFNTSNWPINDIEALNQYGNDEVQQLATHFEEQIENQQCNVHDVLEWREVSYQRNSSESTSIDLP